MLDILQSIPILGFFPIVLVLFVSTIPGQLGVSLAVIFLIFTSMAWNITFSVYEAVKAIPKQYLNLVVLEKMSFFKRLTVLYIPASWSKVAYNSIISWAVALFYLVSSEIFTLGVSQDQVKYGIGVDIANYASSSSWAGYSAAVVTLVAVDLLTWILILDQFSRWAEQYKMSLDPVELRANRVYRFYTWLSGACFTRLAFALSRGRKYMRFTRLPVRVSRMLIPKSGVSFRMRSTPFKVTVGCVLPLLGLVFLIDAFRGFALNSLPLVLTQQGIFSKLTTDEMHVVIAIAYSFAGVWGSYVISVAIALPLGVFIALSDRVYSVMAPVLQVVASIPAPVLLPPIALVIATIPGGGELDALIVIVVAMTWYIMFNVMEGVRTVPKELRQLSTLLELRGLRAWRHVFLPSAIPSFITGSVNAIGGAWNALIVAEYFSIGFFQNGSVVKQVSVGIGKLLDLATSAGDWNTLLLSLISLTALIVCFNLLVWKRLYAYATKRFAPYVER